MNSINTDITDITKWPLSQPEDTTTSFLKRVHLLYDRVYSLYVFSEQRCARQFYSFIDIHVIHLIRACRSMRILLIFIWLRMGTTLSRIIGIGFSPINIIANIKNNMKLSEIIFNSDECFSFNSNPFRMFLFYWLGGPLGCARRKSIGLRHILRRGSTCRVLLERRPRSSNDFQKTLCQIDPKNGMHNYICGAF